MLYRISLPALLVGLAACSSAEQSGATTGGHGGAGGNGDTGGAGAGAPSACASSFDADTVHLAAGAKVSSGQDTTMCLRWTTPDALDISSFVGTIGPAGHHALLLARPGSTEPDGLAPCSEAELMDAETYGDFQMLAGVSYETDGVKVDFPSAPVQIGLHVDAGTQLVLDAHFLNTGGDDIDACATIDLARGKPVVAKLVFRTVLPKEEYALSVPAHGSIDAVFEEPVGGHFRIAAASSHMHAGGTHFRMSVKETDQTIYETTTWAEPKPATFEAQKFVVDENQTFKLECSFTNDGAAAQHFPAQMCVGGMYLLPCTLPGAC